MTSISKNVYIDKLDDIVYKCNSTVAIIKMKPVDVKLNTSINSAKKLIIMILNLKLVIFREYQNTKIFLKKVTLQIPLKKFLWLKKLKTLFTKNNCKKTNQKEFRVQKLMKRKSNKLHVKWKGYDNSFNSWIDKKDLTKMSEYF